ncbi:MAG: hypothetical protein GY715_09120 [Planctomycetes bacterium]|nr:hypothetical protein [Planctomycetota bacterium]
MRHAGVAMLALMVLVAARSATAQLGGHGVGVAAICEEPRCVGQTTLCLYVVSHNDQFGDTTSILSAFDIVDPAGDAIRVPATGSLDILAVEGNTTAVPGPFTGPILLGPAGSVLSGLPGEDEPGEVTFVQNTYVIQPDDPNPLRTQPNFSVVDLCNAPGTSGCSSLPNLAQFGASTLWVDADVDLVKTANPTRVPQGVPTPVTFSFAATNTGAVPLVNVVLDDDLCGVFLAPDSGDDNLNGALDPGETWLYSCVVPLSTSTVSTATLSEAAIVDCPVEDTATVEVIANPPPSRGDPSEKGSLVLFSKIDIRWDSNGGLLQDTFLSLTNDFPEDVLIQTYFINGDPPLEADPITGERAHPGWNFVDNRFPLTGDQPTYWSALTGQPAAGGLAPFTSLDPGFPPGRPVGDGTGDRMLRGFAVAWAVNPQGGQIRWNHLKGEGTIVDYLGGSAWEYGTTNFKAVAGNHGDPVGTPGIIRLDGAEFVEAFDLLLFSFHASGSAAFSGPRQVLVEPDLTIQPVPADLRQETAGPVTTKADFSVFNGNEVKFSGAHRCVTCWDQTLLGDYGVPNHFLLQHLQTDHGKARIDGKASQVCDVDHDPGDGPLGAHPLDVISADAPLVALRAHFLVFDGGVDHGAGGIVAGGMGRDGTAIIRYDP